MRTATTTLEGAPGSVPVARRWVRSTLTDWGLPGTAWTTAQVVSELATNCALHARTPFTLTLELGDDGLRLEVSDTSPAPLQPRLHTETATTGRGLRIVDSLALQWGVVPHAPGKTVWVALPVEVGDAGRDDLPGRTAGSGADATAGRGSATRASTRTARALLRGA